MKARRVPLRKCVACQEMMPKKALIRVVRTPQDEVLIDLTGKKSGRGAYLCGKLNCFELARRQRALDRALKASVSAEIYERLQHDFVQVEGEFNINNHRSGGEGDG